uniref:RecBCD enzyme subunit RecB n=1 Tax=Chlorobium chlorochromatii (strain CaD3) TaxID=340177 RepID=Q3ASJ0_CHLCH
MHHQPLNHTTVTLAGINLIEASAGTGKTYAIASLYVRLLLEKQLLPEQILVVTYTEAATQELRGRIRSRIREVLEVFEGAATSDAIVQRLYDQALEQGDDMVERARMALVQALALFDTAAIFTIHGFCLRVLQEHAFESGSLYDTTLVTDQRALLLEIVEDFWRTHFFGEASPLLAYTLQCGGSPESFLALLQKLHVSGGATIIPTFCDEEREALHATCLVAYAELCRLWQSDGAAVRELLSTDKGLSRAADYYRADKLELLFAGMEEFIAGGNPFNLFADFQKFATSGIAAGTKPKGTSPDHPLFACAEKLLQAVQKRYVALKSELVQFYQRELPKRKRKANFRFFDDLLSDLADALQAPERGVALAQRLRSTYQAALIDEFQDTDPVQYIIFQTMYADSDAPLFLIGDPKQAIYSFRGADIFAYMQAARAVEASRRFTLSENWRSTPQLLNAFNQLFSNERLPFIYPDIIYHPLQAGNPDVANGEESAPALQFYLLEGDDAKGDVLSVEQGEALAAEATAGELYRLLQAGEIIGGKQVAAGDCAVIVRTHAQAAQMVAALQRRGIAGVVRSDKSVFATREAEELRQLLIALADPAHEVKVRSALITDILGRSGDDCAELLADEVAWLQVLRRFRHYHHVWQHRGVMVMSRELMADEGVRGRLLASPDGMGERRLTNVLHCIELLHRQEHEHGFGCEELLQWFSERISLQDELQEEYQLRLESDEAAVRIVTVHASKGLEYPIVFCPFLWNSVGNRRDEVVSFHNEVWQLVKDFGSPERDRHRVLAGRESLAEQLRLLYVALTRAKYRCTVLLARIKSEASAFNYLLHASDATRQSNKVVLELEQEMKGISSEERKVRLHDIAKQSAGAIGVRQLSRVEIEALKEQPRLVRQRSAEPLHLRHFAGTVDGSWRVASFTSFSRHESTSTHFASPELPDRDEVRSSTSASTMQPTLPSEQSIAAFPKGARAGILLHALFEELNFANPTDEAIAERVTEELARSIYPLSWQSTLITIVQAVLQTPLAALDGSTFQLGTLHAKSWITELEFFFPLRFINSKELSALLTRHGVLPGGIALADMVEVLDFKPVRGMVMGFMDMVFESGGRYYLLDWKSNYLGASPADYTLEAMGRAMQEHLYPLQYLLYMVALHRYLALRIPNYRYSTHIGGVIYVFLRGVTPEFGEARGFYRDLPSEALIEELTALLVDFEG